MEHSKGPWVVSAVFGAEIEIYRSGTSVTIAKVCIGPDITTDEAIANALLISAATELLESVKIYVSDFFRGFTDDDREAFRRDYPNHSIVKAEAAVAKAKGAHP